MKKTTITLLMILFTLLLPKDLFCAYGIDFDGKGFYSSIVDSMGTLENSLYQLDIVEGENTKERINKLANQECINEEFTPEEIRQIAVNGNVELIISKIKEECKNGDVVSVSLIGNTLSAIQKVHDEALEYAVWTTHNVMNLDSTGIYSDGIKENAPFDLIVDIQNIDKIIFTQETDSYDDAKYMNVGEEVALALAKANYSSVNGNYIGGNYGVGVIGNQYYNDLKIFNELNSTNTTNQYMCPYEGSSSSGLNDEDLKDLLSSSDDSNSTGGVDSGGNLGDGADSWGDYQKVNDNSQFPCTEYFCINTEFVTHNSGMFLGGGGDQDMSIEGIITRSNKHLKEYAGTSLIGSKMTINNFEFGLKDLNLSEMFHLGFQIYWKPVPILNLTYVDEKNKQNESTSSGTKVGEDSGQFSVDGLLKFYYETYGLDFSRRNDLSLLKKYEVDKQIIIDTSRMTPNYVASKYTEYNEYDKIKVEQRAAMQKLIENQTKIDVTGDFELQFKELEVFNRTIRDYSFNLNEILKKMREKPQDKGAN